MKTTLNVMFQNEEKILSQVLKYWKEYPIDHYIFYNDNSTDNSVKIINQILDKKDVTIINSQISSYNESLARQKMLDVSKQLNADLMFSLDCDELLTSNILINWEKFLKYFKTYDVELFWFNCVNNSLKYFRCDPLYKRNFKSFIAPLEKIENWNVHEHKYHQRRVPYVNLPKVQTEQCGVLHLQALNRKYYALKQLWYKHFEFKEYKHSIEFINNRYDPVVNKLQFNEKEIDQKLIEGITIDISVFEQLEIEKGYLAYIKENYTPELVTFGQEYII
jgi:hypothetical protein